MRKLFALLIVVTILLPGTANAFDMAAFDMASFTQQGFLQKERVKKLPPKPKMKWPPPGFEKKENLYAKTATPKELGIVGTENKYIQRKLIDICHEYACLGIFVGSETGCDWWEITSNVLGINPENPEERIIFGSLTTKVAGSNAKTIKPVLLISREPIEDGVGIGTYTANCRSGTSVGKTPSNKYSKSPNRI